MKRVELEKVLRCLGWIFVRHGGNHDVWKRDRKSLAVPRQCNINEITARSILKAAQETEDEEVLPC
ncbi:MAG TPA: type II toxin-antitoxin system HicA family toxin [Myxococcota bacterium]|nr:type II toxin-antitoxin system HicA family toxin [Myxococcota bacterium]HPV04613.1 type II toxin-antitoxin system HicA family toxin [Myxococcota bacterium]